MTPRLAFTLPELLVALTLLAVGVAGWVATSAAAIRLAAAADREIAAHHRARSRAALVAAAPCAAMQGGTAAGERWIVSASGNGIRLVRAEVAFLGHRAPRVAIYELAVAC